MVTLLDNVSRKQVLNITVLKLRGIKIVFQCLTFLHTILRDSWILYVNLVSTWFIDLHILDTYFSVGKQNILQL